MLRVNIRQFFHALQSMPSLKVLYFACDSTHGDGVDWGASYGWPPRLRELSLSGLINEEHPLFFEKFPRSLNYLGFDGCPGLSSMMVYHWLLLNKKSLESLKVVNWLPKGRQDFLDLIPCFIPHVRHLYLAQSSISALFFYGKFRVPAELENQQVLEFDQRHPLETLVLNCDEPHGVLRLDPMKEIDPHMVLVTIALQLHNLRTFKVDDAMGWWMSLEQRQILYKGYWIMRHRAQLRGDQRPIRFMGSGEKPKISSE